MKRFSLWCALCITLANTSSMVAFPLPAIAALAYMAATNLGKMRVDRRLKSFVDAFNYGQYNRPSNKQTFSVFNASLLGAKWENDLSIQVDLNLNNEWDVLARDEDRNLFQRFSKVPLTCSLRLDDKNKNATELALALENERANVFRDVLNSVTRERPELVFAQLEEAQEQRAATFVDSKIMPYTSFYRDEKCNTSGCLSAVNLGFTRILSSLGTDNGAGVGAFKE